MAGGLRLDGRSAWLGASALLAAGALPGWFVPSPLWDWQPTLAFREPWRMLTAAWVHWSPLHLGGNLVATALVAIFGVAARVPARVALAWLLAWPLTHIGLLLQPALLHYGGLSGVLHAGVAVAALWLLVREVGRRRALGAAIATGLLIKIILEEPWGPPLRAPAGLLSGGWDIATAPLAHATGAAAGVLCATLALWASARQSSR